MMPAAPLGAPSPASPPAACWCGWPSQRRPPSWLSWAAVPAGTGSGEPSRLARAARSSADRVGARPASMTQPATTPGPVVKRGGSELTPPAVPPPEQRRHSKRGCPASIAGPSL